MSRETLHRLVDDLPETEVERAQRLLERLRSTTDDPLVRALEQAPADDEPESEEERRAVEQARQEADRGEGIPHEEAMRRLGLR